MMMMMIIILRISLILFTALLIIFELQIVHPYLFPLQRKICYRCNIERLNRLDHLKNVFYPISKESQTHLSTSLSLFESIGIPYPTTLRREDLANLLLAQICITFLRSAYSSTRNQTVEGLWIEEFTSYIDLYTAFSFITAPPLSIHVSLNDDSTNSTEILLTKTAINSILHAMLTKRMESITLYRESPIAIGAFDKYKLTIFPGSYVNSIIAYALKSFEGKHIIFKNNNYHNIKTFLFSFC